MRTPIRELDRAPPRIEVEGPTPTIIVNEGSVRPVAVSSVEEAGVDPPRLVSSIRASSLPLVHPGGPQRPRRYLITTVVSRLDECPSRIRNHDRAAIQGGDGKDHTSLAAVGVGEGPMKHRGECFILYAQLCWSSGVRVVDHAEIGLVVRVVGRVELLPACQVRLRGSYRKSVVRDAPSAHPCTRSVRVLPFPPPPEMLSQALGQPELYPCAKLFEA